ncbi:MAG: 16S rRNA (uracil(1498)-N(3))-methyltransferase [Acidimicrobiales bacterium]
MAEHPDPDERGGPDDGATLRRRCATQVFVSDLESLALDDDDAHHLNRVLRLRDGEAVCATDGSGAWRVATWRSGGIVADGEVRFEPPPANLVGVGFAPVKAERPEWVVQKLTELGVDRISVLRTERSVVRWDDDRLERQLARFRRVAREACQQSRRLHLPTVEQAELTELRAGGAVLAEPGGRPLSPDDRTVLVGPEGGWAPGELADATTVDLNPNVLRGETAALAGAVLLTALRVGLALPRLPSSR